MATDRHQRGLTRMVGSARPRELGRGVYGYDLNPHRVREWHPLTGLGPIGGNIC